MSKGSTTVLSLTCALVMAAAAFTTYAASDSAVIRTMPLEFTDRPADAAAARVTLRTLALDFNGEAGAASATKATLKTRPLEFSEKSGGGAPR